MVSLFQFTPLREGRQRGEAFPSPDDVISIHAPPRGATPRKFQLKKTQRISIHAPPRGATATLTPFRTRRRNFNSRPSARGDQRFRHRAGGRDISIHAPPRGATARERRGRNAPHNFNSRPSARGDGRGRPKKTKAEISIHAPPRGATREAALMLANSFISIHAPPRGATRRFCERQSPVYFNSRPSARGDFCPYP